MVLDWSKPYEFVVTGACRKACLAGLGGVLVHSGRQAGCLEYLESVEIEFRQATWEIIDSM